MDTAAWYEIVGYVGSALVVVSLTMRSLLRLRVINLVGASIFTVYGLLIAAPPVWGVNAAIVIIDIWYLRKMLTAGEDLEVLEVDPAGAYVSRFLGFHASDIVRFQPGFDGVRDDHRGFFVLRDMVPAALVLARPTDEGEMLIDLDYAIPAYRDFTSGEFVYEDDAVFGDLGVTCLVARAGNEDHQRYLTRHGFEPQGDRWRRPVG